MLFRIVFPFLFLGAVCATFGGSGQYVEYDCGGSCGGGCGQSGAYSNPCGQSAPVVQYESVSSGCGDDCGGSYGGGGASSSSRYSSGRSSSSGYHKSSTTITKETRNDHLKIVVGQPQVQVHRTTYVKPAPIVQAPVYQAPVYQAPVAYKQRYVDQSSSYGGDSGGSNYDCAGPCGGSKIVKIIKKTTYSSGGGDVCSTCGGESEAYSSNVEYSQPIVTHRKVTRIVTQPVVTRVIKKTVVTPVETSSYYEDTGSSYGGGGGHGGKRYSSGGYGGGRAKAGAFAYASASAGAGAGSSSGDYVGGGSGCKSGCEEWKK